MTENCAPPEGDIPDGSLWEACERFNYIRFTFVLSTQFVYQADRKGIFFSLTYTRLFIIQHPVAFWALTVVTSGVIKTIVATPSVIDITFVDIWGQTRLCNKTESVTQKGKVNENVLGLTVSSVHKLLVLISPY